MKKKNGSKHHIFPSSRYPELKCDKDNIVVLSEKEHDIYHRLFRNKNPYEIVDYLNRHFWNKKFKISIEEV